MVAVLCVALVVVLRWVKGLGGICWFSFSRISLILSSFSVGGLTRLVTVGISSLNLVSVGNLDWFIGLSGQEDFMEVFQE